MPLIKSDMEQGKELVGQGRLLAQAARGENWSNALDTNQDRLRAASGSAKRLMAGTRMQNKAQQQQQAAEQLQPKGGLAQLMAEKGASKKMVADVQKIEDTPGGKELLYTQAAQEMMKAQGVPKKDVQKVRLYRYGGSVERAYAKGGKVKAAAERTRTAGRGEDEMLVHMTEEEFGVIKGMWGEPDINPNTGLPEYGWLSKIWKKVKKVVKKVVSSKIFQVIAPIALSIFVPGLGAAIGGMLAPSVGAAGQAIIGNALVRGGLSAAGGEGFASGAIKGAISGGLGSVAGKYVKDFAGDALSDRTAEIVGSGLAGGAASSLTGGDFVSGAVAGGLGEYMRPGMERLTERGQELFGVEPVEGQILAGKRGQTLEEIDLSSLPQPRGIEAGGPGRAEAEGMFGDVGGGGKPATIQGDVDVAPKTNLLQKYALPALLGASALSGGEYEEGEAPELPPGFTESLPVYSMNRQFQGMDPEAYYTYGQVGAPQSGQHLFLQPQPFAGETGTPTVGPQAGAGGGPGGRGGGRGRGSAAMRGMISAGQTVPANLVGAGGEGILTQAGYTQNPSTGDWMPSQQRFSARGGYQQGGEFDPWSQNADVPSAIPTVAAQGRYVKGPGSGRSDDIPARLSDGEYVIDAEAVALLGDGSGEAGARRLDEMRQNLRKHKAKNLMKGGFSHKAKAPQQYMARGGMAKLRRAMTESGRV